MLAAHCCDECPPYFNSFITDSVSPSTTTKILEVSRYHEALNEEKRTMMTLSAVFSAGLAITLVFTLLAGIYYCYHFK